MQRKNENKFEKEKEEIPFLQQVKMVDAQLDDFDNGRRVSFEEKVESYLPHAENEIVCDKECGLKEENLIYILEPECPKCGSRQVQMNGTNIRTLRFPNGSKKYRIQRYLCPECSRSFQPSLSALKKNSQYFQTTKSQVVRNIVENRSLRKGVNNYALLRKGITVCAQTGLNWLREIGEKLRRLREKFSIIHSGIYVHDEQFIEMNRKRLYRFALRDVITGQLIHEEIREKNDADTIYNFLLSGLRGKKVAVLIEDGCKEYPCVIERLNRSPEIIKVFGKIYVQRCVFHILKDFRKELSEVKKLIKRKKEKDISVSYQTEYEVEWKILRLTFTLDDDEKIKRIIDSLPSGYKEKVVRILETSKPIWEKAREIFDIIFCWRYHYHPQIRKKLEAIDKIWDEATLFYRMKDVPKTTNSIEQFFSSTQPEKIKYRFRTIDTLLSYLSVLDGIRTGLLFSLNF